MTIISSIRDYLLTCPHLKELEGVTRVRVDFSDDSETSTYCIEEVPSNPIIKKYIDNSSDRQFLFVFSSIEPYSIDIQQNIDNVGFYEHFQNWLETNTRSRILPVMEEGKEALKIEALTNGYLFSNEEGVTNSRYQVQCKLTYLQK